MPGVRQFCVPNRSEVSCDTILRLTVLLEKVLTTSTFAFNVGKMGLQCSMKSSESLSVARKVL